LAEGQVVNQAQLEVVRDIELTDGLLKSPVVLVGRLTAGPVAIRVGQNLRKHVGGLERQPARITLLEAQNGCAVRRIAAIVAAAAVGVDTVVLRIRTQSLPHRGAAAPGGDKSGVWLANSRGICQRR